ncbi:hypothetical protein [Halodesulfovibrio spirochaetisodalis]|uniref:Uncharacterized protein n=1 Tax=Halodesulfovibrio spirochaetisodalis TaxID=1560234 RepID=A0A1B7XEX8_9BACT|nr:hypothetical protein [Halodesulfovibrio spirochaetisodalis]OBQ52735.1 hypothetical protein SP90_07210 [Halodesulfovibrio spirochaetisodalis]
MRSAVSICNKGLQFVGGSPIVSLEEDSRGAQLCSQLYEQVRDELLEAHHWSFATRYVRLPRLPEKPPFHFASAYQLPADCIGVRQLQDSKPFEVVEGRVLYTDSNPAKAIITVRVSDPAQYPAMFVETLARKLAAELSVPLMNSTKLEQSMYNKFLATFARAAAADGAEGVQQVHESDGWLHSRTL